MEDTFIFNAGVLSASGLYLNPNFDIVGQVVKAVVLCPSAELLLFFHQRR